MKQYAGGDKDAASKHQAGEDAVNLLEVSKGSSDQGSSGNYQQYMDKYGDYQQYMKKYAGASQGGSQSQQGNYQEYYGKYMKQYAGGDKDGAAAKHQAGEDAVNLLEVSKGSSDQGSSGNYQQYMDKYGDYQQYMKKYTGGSQGGSQSGDYQQYMKKYAGGSQGGSQS